MRRNSLLIAILIMLIAVITACGSSDVTTGEPTPTPVPTVVDYSDNKDLTKSQADEILLAWETDNKDYSLRGNIVYYGTFNGYLVLQAPITDGGITEGEYGYRRFESDGPVEIFLYGENADKTKVFYTLSQAISLGLIEDLAPIHRQHFVYCEQALGYSYSFDMMTPPEAIKTYVDDSFSEYAYMELPWHFATGISYYGEYNGYHIVMVEPKEVHGTIGSENLSVIFPSVEADKEYYLMAYSYTEGSREVTGQRISSGFFESVNITAQEVQTIYNLYQNYELDYFRKLVEPDVVGTDLPNVVDYSEDKSLTQEQVEKIQTEWVKWTAKDDVLYQLRGDLVYLGTFDDYMIIHAPITEGGIADNAGYRNFESDGPVEFFAYGSLGTLGEGFHRVMFVMVCNLFADGNYSKIIRRNQMYCEETFGYDYTTEMLLPPEEIRADIMDKVNAQTGQEATEWDHDEGMTYYGEYNGYHIVFVKLLKGNYLGAVDYYGDFAFWGSGTYSETAYKDGKIYFLKSLFEKGEITLDEIKQMYEQFQKYNLDAARKRDLGTK